MKPFPQPGVITLLVVILITCALLFLLQKMIWFVVPFLLALIIIDVAIRRIAWDWASTKRMAAAASAYVRSFTTTRKVEHSAQTMGALKQVREQVAEQRFKVGPEGTTGTTTTAPPPVPSRTAASGPPRPGPTRPPSPGGPGRMSRRP